MAQFSVLPVKLALKLLVLDTEFRPSKAERVPIQNHNALSLSGHDGYEQHVPVLVMIGLLSQGHIKSDTLYTFIYKRFPMSPYRGGRRLCHPLILSNPQPLPQGW